MAEVISHESNFNQVQTSEREKICLFVMLLMEDSGKTKKVKMRADITQQEEKIHHEKGMENEREKKTIKRRRGTWGREMLV